MNIVETIAQIKSQLEQIGAKEEANQQEQVAVNQRIERLEIELKKQQLRRNKLDEEALQLYTQAEELKPRLDKLERIANLSQEFLELHAECQDNQDLLNTLYSSVTNRSVSETQTTKDNSSVIEGNEPELEIKNDNNNSNGDYKISIEDIKHVLPNAEKVYQQLVAGYLEEYKTYQNFIVDDLDLIWYSVAFIAFGRSAYRKMSFKYHPDQAGSERAMQLINTAWSISRNFLESVEKENDAVNSL
jgi:chromosome segregation ATPase